MTHEKIQSMAWGQLHTELMGLHSETHLTPAEVIGRMAFIEQVIRRKAMPYKQAIAAMKKENEKAEY